MCRLTVLTTTSFFKLLLMLILNMLGCYRPTSSTTSISQLLSSWLLPSSLSTSCQVPTYAWFSSTLVPVRIVESNLNLDWWTYMTRFSEIVIFSSASTSYTAKKITVCPSSNHMPLDVLEIFQLTILSTQKISGIALQRITFSNLDCEYDLKKDCF